MVSLLATSFWDGKQPSHPLHFLETTERTGFMSSIPTLLLEVEDMGLWLVIFLFSLNFSNIWSTAMKDFLILLGFIRARLPCLSKSSFNLSKREKRGDLWETEKAIGMFYLLSLFCFPFFPVVSSDQCFVTFVGGFREKKDKRDAAILFCWSGFSSDSVYLHLQVKCSICKKTLTKREQDCPRWQKANFIFHFTFYSAWDHLILFHI